MVAADDYKKIQKRTEDKVCARCRRVFEPGDRIQHAFILVNTNAYNPNNVTERGLELGTDCEFVHASCKDPQLTGSGARAARSQA